MRSELSEEKLNYEYIKRLWKDEKEKVVKAKQKAIDACKMLETAKIEAIKEFAERLKEDAYPNALYVEVEDIDNLVKEMVGDTDATN